MARIRLYAAPVLLLLVGVLLLLGCIPIPATWQEQSDGRPRPEHAIGTRPDDPVRLGYTHIDDAIIQLSRRVGGKSSFSSWWPSVTAGQISGPSAIYNWRVSADRRHFSVPYSLRTGIQVWPFCFAITQDTRQRWLTLNVDDRGVVVSTKTTKEPPVGFSMQPGEWLHTFDEPTRRKLQHEGVLPSDETLSTWQAAQDRWRAKTRPTTGR